MNRLIVVVAALAIAPAALAQETATAQEDPQPEPFDASAMQGKIDSLAEGYAETRNDVASLKKLKFSGYVQPRFAWREDVSYNALANQTTSTGAANPQTPAQSGLFIRRGRFKGVYDADWAQFSLQVDATTTSVALKEAFASVKLPWASLAVDAGLQLFPFGYEVGVRSSSDLDLLERAAVSRSYLAGEYDLGVAVKGPIGSLPLQFKVGLFNGNGVDARSGADNDQRKDLIGRIGYDLGVLTGGVSGWYGKTTVFRDANLAGGGASDTTHGRYRVGADAQLYLDVIPFLGGTAVKGEYIWGRTSISTSNEGAGGNLGLTGSGWYGLVTQNVGPVNQVAFRYEEFTANHDAALTGSTVKTTRGVQAAVHTYLGSSAKISVAYFHPMNGERAPGVASDPGADQLIVQTQAKF
jgi:hypothetical protein